jgi:hypothetical protein
VTKAIISKAKKRPWWWAVQFLANIPSQDLLDPTKSGRSSIRFLAWRSWKTTGTNNAYILWMWENVKSSGAIQPWIHRGSVVIEVATALGFGLYFFSQDFERASACGNAAKTSA